MSEVVGRDRLSLVDRLVGAGFSLLVAAVAVYVAVRLVLAVWTALLVIAGVATCVGLAVTFLRSRNRRW